MGVWLILCAGTANVLECAGSDGAFGGGASPAKAAWRSFLTSRRTPTPVLVHWLGWTAARNENCSVHLRNTRRCNPASWSPSYADNRSSGQCHLASWRHEGHSAA